MGSHLLGYPRLFYHIKNFCVLTMSLLFDSIELSLIFLTFLIMDTQKTKPAVWDTHRTFIIGLVLALFIGVPMAYAIGGTVFGSGLSETPRHEQNLQRLTTDFQRLQRIVDEAKASQAVNRKLQVSVLIDIAKSKAKDEQEKEDVSLEEVKRLIDKAYCLEGIYYDAEVNWGTIILDDICSFQEYPVEEVFTME